jgi:hypothetical protein
LQQKDLQWIKQATCQLWLLTEPILLKYAPEHIRKMKNLQLRTQAAEAKVKRLQDR